MALAIGCPFPSRTRPETSSEPVLTVSSLPVFWACRSGAVLAMGPGVSFSAADRAARTSRPTESKPTDVRMAMMIRSFTLARVMVRSTP